MSPGWQMGSSLQSLNEGAVSQEVLWGQGNRMNVPEPGQDPPEPIQAIPFPASRRICVQLPLFGAYWS